MKIEIMQHIWIVKLKNKQEMDKESVDTLGITHFPIRQIDILDTLRGETLEQVVTHEVVHALLDEFSCNNLDTYNDEFVCDFIANNILMIQKIADKIIDFINDTR